MLSIFIADLKSYFPYASYRFPGKYVLSFIPSEETGITSRQDIHSHLYLSLSEIHQFQNAISRLFFIYKKIHING